MKWVVIVGASSGIGLALAEAFASRGVCLGVAARRTAPLRELQEKYPDNVTVAEIDIIDTDAAGRLCALAREVGGMDYYIHVAGIGYDNPTLSPQREAEITETNAMGFARMVSAAYRWMRDHGVRGHIAAVTSIAGTKGIGRMSAYSASKRFASTYLTAMEQLSCAERAGISFTDIRPGWVRTPLLHGGKSYPMEMTVGRVLPRIIRAIVRRERVAVVDWRWRTVVSLWRMIPDRVWVRMATIADALSGR